MAGATGYARAHGPNIGPRGPDQNGSPSSRSISAGCGMPPDGASTRCRHRDFEAAIKRLQRAESQSLTDENA